MSSAEMVKKAAYSLIVRKGVRFEIPMSGTEWTYIGASGAPNGIRYQNRRFEQTRVYFVFDPLIVGEYLLEFTRQDLLIDDIESMYVRVIVDPEDGEAAIDAAASPSTSPASPKAAVSPTGSTLTETASPGAAPPGAAPQKTQSSPAPASAAPVASAPVEDLSGFDGPALLKKAQKEIESGKAASAWAALEEYRLRYPAGDEYLYWAARAAELPGPARDILKARALYVQLKEDFPESPRYDEADARIEYIDRRYLEIR